jgi:hypothetical protein
MGCGNESGNHPAPRSLLDSLAVEQRVDVTLPRVALEYGHTWSASRMSFAAVSGSSTEGSVTSSVTASLKPPLPSGSRLTAESMAAGPASR